MVIAIAWRVMAIGFIHRALEQEKRLNCVEDPGQAHGIKIHEAVETRLNLPQTVECVSRLVSAIYDKYSEDVNQVLHGMVPGCNGLCRRQMDLYDCRCFSESPKRGVGSQRF